MKTYKASDLPNGLKIFSSYTQGAEAISINIVFRAGSRYEKDDERGYAHLLEHVFFSAGKKYKSDTEVKAFVDSLGGYINAHTDSSGINFIINILAKDAEKIFNLLSDILINPNFRKKELEKEKKIIDREIQRNSDNLAFLAGKHALIQTFKGHPLSNHPEGSKAVIAKATTRSLDFFYRRWCAPGRTAIITAGGLKHEDAVRLIKKHFGDWKSNNHTDTITEEKISLTAKGGYFFKEKNISDTHLVFNFLTEGADHIEKIMALELINSYLARGASSLLKEELRMKRGLVYTIASHNTYYKDAGRFLIQTSTSNPKEVVGVVLQKLKNLSQDFDDKTIIALKEKTINSMILLNTDPLYSNDLVQSFLKRGELFSIKDKIALLKKVTTEDVVNVSKKYLIPQKLILVALGPEDIGSTIK